MRFLLSALLLALAAAGCGQTREFQNLRQVDFDLDGVRDVRLAGVLLDSVRGYGDLSAADLLRISGAAARRDVPLTMTVLVGADNPAANGPARMLRLDYTLLLDDRETVSGTVNREIAMPAGQRVVFPVEANLDLVDFFGDDPRGLVNLALALAGRGGAASRVKLVGRPTVRTAFGDVRYPGTVTLVDRRVGEPEQR